MLHLYVQFMIPPLRSPGLREEKNYENFRIDLNMDNISSRHDMNAQTLRCEFVKDVLAYDMSERRCLLLSGDADILLPCLDSILVISRCFMARKDSSVIYSCRG